MTTNTGRLLSWMMKKNEQKIEQKFAMFTFVLSHSSVSGEMWRWGDKIAAKKVSYKTPTQLEPISEKREKFEENSKSFFWVLSLQRVIYCHSRVVHFVLPCSQMPIAYCYCSYCFVVYWKTHFARIGSHFWAVKLIKARARAHCYRIKFDFLDDAILASPQKFEHKKLENCVTRRIFQHCKTLINPS